MADHPTGASLRKGWTKIKVGLWRSPCGQFVAKREEHQRWSLWQGPAFGKLAEFTEISVWQGSLRDCQEWLRERNRLADDDLR